MRIKFERGITPERIAQEFVRYIRENDIVIGAVNIYIQTWDEETGKYRNKHNDSEYMICRPTEIAKEEYRADVANIRRGRIKRVI